MTYSQSGTACLLGKAKQSPDLVAQVIQNIKKEGLAATFSKVKTKLDSFKALGLSTSGTVVTSMDKKGFFKPGDRLTCASQNYASHAEKAYDIVLGKTKHYRIYQLLTLELWFKEFFDNKSTCYN